jgi:hypothetical protein
MNMNEIVEAQPATDCTPMKHLYVPLPDFDYNCPKGSGQ